jgi:hypothetical protein
MPLGPTVILRARVCSKDHGHSMLAGPVQLERVHEIPPPRRIRRPPSTLRHRRPPALSWTSTATPASSSTGASPGTRSPATKRRRSSDPHAVILSIRRWRRRRVEGKPSPCPRSAGWRRGAERGGAAATNGTSYPSASPAGWATDSPCARSLGNTGTAPGFRTAPLTRCGPLGNPATVPALPRLTRPGRRRILT